MNRHRISTEEHGWDDNYRKRGRLWGGSVAPIPGLHPGMRILELGCGNGKTVSSLVQAGYRATAIDLSAPAARLCRRTCPDPERVEILVADARQLPFRDRSFDLILASHVAGHLTPDGRNRLATEADRLLAHGGRVIFRDFSTTDFRFGRGEEIGPGTFLRKNGIATHYFTEGEVRDLFASLSMRSISEHRWSLRVRGVVYLRAEIVADLGKA